MMNQDEIALTLAAKLLNEYSNTIKKEDIGSLVNDYINEEVAYQLLIFSMCGLNMDNQIDKDFYHNYISKMIKLENTNNYLTDSYFNLNLSDIKDSSIELRWDKYNPYELFALDDIKKIDGYVVPKLAFFNEEYKYPAIYKNDRIWMSVIPNEINTMKNDIKLLNGNVVVCGLGMGYILYHLVEKEDVNKIIVVEKDEEIIRFFNKHLKDQFPNIYKVEIINDDALNYLKHLPNEIDMVYIDLWHDASDGIPIYLKCKRLENKYRNKVFRYWIEESMKIYIDLYK